MHNYVHKKSCWCAINTVDCKSPYCRRVLNEFSMKFCHYCQGRLLLRQIKRTGKLSHAIFVNKLFAICHIIGIKGSNKSFMGNMPNAAVFIAVK